jgi:SAM-dependent methyltransferase
MNRKPPIRPIVGRVKSLLLNVERGHKLNLPLRQYEIDRYRRESAACFPNSVFKLEMLMVPAIQEEFIEILSLIPLAGGESQLPSDTHVWNAERIRDDCLKKLGKYGFEGFIDRVKDTVAVKCRPHNGECVLMNNHSYVKVMEVIYTGYIIDIQPTDVVMNLACGNTYWPNVWLAGRCRYLHCNDNGFYVPIHDKSKQAYNYNQYQPGITTRIEFREFDASQSFPYPDNTFDKTVSHSSIEHIDNWETNVLPEIIRTLKPGGKCGLASCYHPLGRENLGRGQSSWWTKKKWDRFVKLQEKLGFEIIGNTSYNYGVPWRAEEDTDRYKFGGSVYITNFIFFRKKCDTCV